jgi:hypothetical protein
MRGRHGASLISQIHRTTHQQDLLWPLSGMRLRGVGQTIAEIYERPLAPIEAIA